MKIAIVGTAGRQLDGLKMTSAIFNKMILYVKEWIANVSPEHSEITLVSGGSAWADHVAVRLYLEAFLTEDETSCVPRINGLKLHLPCAFGEGQLGNAGFDRKSPVGSRLNELHHLFGRKMLENNKRFNSLNEIRTAILLGAAVEVKDGFHARNTMIARSAVDGLIAFTWGNDWTQPKDGGTYDTWKKSTSPYKVHVPLGWLEQATDESIREFLDKSSRSKRRRLSIQSFFPQSEARCSTTVNEDNVDEQLEASITAIKSTVTSYELLGNEYELCCCNKRKRI